MDPTTFMDRLCDALENRNKKYHYKELDLQNPPKETLYYGRSKDGNRNQSLMKVVRRFKKWMLQFQVDEKEHKLIFVTSCLRGAAEQFIDQLDTSQSRLDDIYALLYQKWPEEDRLKEYRDKVMNFKYKPKTNMETHISYFVSLIFKLDEQYRLRHTVLWNMGRLPHSLHQPGSIETYEAFYASLLGIKGMKGRIRQLERKCGVSLVQITWISL